MRNEPLQFDLRHLFFFISGACVYFAVVRVTGPLLPALAMGAFALSSTVILLRIENILVGGILGTILSVVILSFAQLALGPMTDGMLFSAWILSPMLGYIMGIVSAADRAFRLGR